MRRVLAIVVAAVPLYVGAVTVRSLTTKDVPAASCGVNAATWNGSKFICINPGTGSPVVTVAVSPTTASVATSGTQQFAAAVTGSTNTSVSWSATCGSVSSGGLYTAPSTAGVCTVTATSQADTTASASATVSVSASSSNGPIVISGTCWDDHDPLAGSTSTMTVTQSNGQSLLAEAGGTIEHYVRCAPSPAPTLNNPYTFCVTDIPGGVSTVKLGIETYGTRWDTATFDLSGLTVTGTAGGATASIGSVGGVPVPCVTGTWVAYTGSADSTPQRITYSTGTHANTSGTAVTVSAVTLTKLAGAPTISGFTASPSSITAGQSSTLSWAVTGAASVSIDQGIGVVTGTSRAVNPAVSTTYTLTATSSSGLTSTATASVTVTSAAGSFPPDTTMAAYTMPTIAAPTAGSPITNTFGSLGSTYNTTTALASQRLHHYPKNQPWNSDETRLLLSPSANVYTANPRYLVDGTTYADIGDLLGSQTYWPSGPRTWANSDPRYIYGTANSALQWIRIDASTTPAVTTLPFGRAYTAADFGLSTLTYISYGEYEGNLDDGDTGAVLLASTSGGSGAETEVVLINPKTGAVRCRVTTGYYGSGHVAQDATMGRDGSYFTVNWNGNGLQMFRTSDCAFVRQLSTRQSHYDTCISTAGKQVVVQGGYASGCSVGMIDVTTGTEIGVYPTDSCNEHISCRNTQRPGWAYLADSNYTGCDSAMLQNRIIAVKLDGSYTVENFAWSHQACSASEAATVMAVPSRKGDRVFFKAAWDNAQGGTTPDDPTVRGYVSHK